MGLNPEAKTMTALRCMMAQSWWESGALDGETAEKWKEEGWIKEPKE